MDDVDMIKKDHEADGDNSKGDTDNDIFKEGNDTSGRIVCVLIIRHETV